MEALPDINISTLIFICKKSWEWLKVMSKQELNRTAEQTRIEIQNEFLSHVGCETLEDYHKKITHDADRWKAPLRFAKDVERYVNEKITKKRSRGIGWGPVTTTKLDPLFKFKGQRPDKELNATVMYLIGQTDERLNFSHRDINEFNKKRDRRVPEVDAFILENGPAHARNHHSPLANSFASVATGTVGLVVATTASATVGLAGAGLTLAASSVMPWWKEFYEVAEIAERSVQMTGETFKSTMHGFHNNAYRAGAMVADMISNKAKNDPKLAAFQNGESGLGVQGQQLSQQGQQLSAPEAQKQRKLTGGTAPGGLGVFSS